MNPGIYMSSRLTYLLGLIAITVLLLSAYYFEYFEGLMPCPLCLLQRFAFLLLGGTFLFGILLNKKRWARITINILSFLFSGLGIALASRQVWLQHFPPADTGECAVSLQYMMQALPFGELIQKVFQGSAECSARTWELLSLSMAEWALVCFVGFMCMSIYLIWKEFK